MPLDDIVTGDIVIIPRAEWGAKPAKKSRRIKHPVAFIYLNICTYTESCCNKEECVKIIQEMQRRDMEDKGMDDIQYNFLLTDDGTVYEGRGWFERPHPIQVLPNMDGRILEIACVGDFSDKFRTDAMFKAQWEILHLGMVRKYLTKECTYW